MTVYLYFSLIPEALIASNLPPEKRPVNMVFQRYALFPHLDVFENVAYGLKVKGLGKDEVRERVRNMLRIVQMEHLQQREALQI